MNTQVKVGIAAAIVAALIALIVLDQKTTPKDDPAGRSSTGGDATTIVGTNQGAEPPANRLDQAEIDKLLKNAEKQFGEATSPKQPEKPSKGTEERNEKTITATGEEYVIKPGDTFETIARSHHTTAAKIAEANPTVKHTSLTIGKKIILPGKVVEKKEEMPVANKTKIEEPKQDATPAPAPKQPDMKTTAEGKKVYTVQAGDTLSGISVKVYNTSRHYQKIYEANKEAIEDPNTLQVGLNLVMPDLPAKAVNGGAPGTGATPVVQTPPAPAPAGTKVVSVNEGDRLWNIAAKFAAERKIGIMDMIKIIVDANVDKKIREDGSNLRAGWQLVIPD